MRATLRSTLLPLLLALACRSAVSSDAASPPALDPGNPASEGEPPGEDSEGASTDEAEVSRCGVGGTARENAETCEFLVRTSSGECCFSTQEAACREVGCSVDDCSLQKSNPPQPICDGPPDEGSAACAAAGGECIPKAAAVPCKRELAATCPGQQICCAM